MPQLPDWLRGFTRVEPEQSANGPQTFVGSIDGAEVTVRFYSESSGSITVWRTSIEVPYTPGTPQIMFAIHSGQAFFTDVVREGLMRDLELGDPEFDREFVVCAAPEDIVRQLLSPTVRAAMLESPPLLIETEPTVLVVHWNGWINDTDALERRARFIIDFARRIEPAAVEAATVARNDPAGAAYRQFKTDDDIARDRAEDIRALEAVGARRAAVERRRALRMKRIALSVVAIVLAATAWFVSRNIDVRGGTPAPDESHE